MLITFFFIYVYRMILIKMKSNKFPFNFSFFTWNSWHLAIKNSEMIGNDNFRNFVKKFSFPIYIYIFVFHEEFFWRQAIIIFDWTVEQAIKITKDKNNELFLLILPDIRI